MSQGTNAAAAHAPTAGKNYLNAEKGLRSWLFTLDHKRISVMYMISVLVAFCLGGSFAVTLRLHLFMPKAHIISAETYNQMFTLHGAVMVFLFIIPSIPAALGNFLVPLMLGAKDVAFPRLNLLSLYMYWLGGIIMITAIIAGGVDTGWTFYVPYSSTTNTAVATMTFGIFVVGFSSILTGLNFIVSIHKLRAPGLTWGRLPLFLWATYATSVVQIVATPVLGITLLLLIAERVFSIGIFDPALGGDPVLFQHFFWFYSHPAVYIMILPGMGVVSEIIPVHSRRHIFGYFAVVLSSMALALLGFLVWGHHMFVSGESEMSSAVFSFLTFFVAIPSGVKMWNWLATLYGGSIRLTTPMLWALSFLILFAIGGLTGFHLGMLNVDIHLHDTYFVVGHFHFVAMGSTVIAFMGGLHHWWSKFFGRKYNENLGRIGAIVIFIGVNVTFIPQLIMGARGMPRRYYHYLDQFHTLHQVSTMGSWIIGGGFLFIICYLIHSLVKGERVTSTNPWGAASLEWQTASPPITENFEQDPVVTHGPYDFEYFPLEAEEAAK